MKFIQLTKADGTPAYVNPAHVAGLSSATEDGRTLTGIYYIGSDEPFIVSESAEEVKNQVEKALQ